uniref:Putative secreted protein n=1 Tax=Anopheles darlingi TaxID=43151 RepID=A0A2M4DIS0_ANODA
MTPRLITTTILRFQLITIINAMSSRSYFCSSSINAIQTSNKHHPLNRRDVPLDVILLSSVVGAVFVCATWFEESTPFPIPFCKKRALHISRHRWARPVTVLIA